MVITQMVINLNCITNTTTDSVWAEMPQIYFFPIISERDFCNREEKKPGHPLAQHVAVQKAKNRDNLILGLYSLQILDGIEFAQ